MHGLHALQGTLSGHLAPSTHWVFFQRRGFLPMSTRMVHTLYLVYLVSWCTSSVAFFLRRRGFLPMSTRMVHVLYLVSWVFLWVARSSATSGYLSSSW